MSRASKFELLLAGLIGQRSLYPPAQTPERAYAELMRLTGQDFGYDTKAWERWLDANVEGWRFATRPNQAWMTFPEFLFEFIVGVVRIIGEDIFKWSKRN
jgi:hypothetical protein